jgi:hypothetical protein
MTQIVILMLSYSTQSIDATTLLNCVLCIQPANFLTRIAQIIGITSREVYSLKPISEQDRIAAAHRLGKQLHQWKTSLPPHLGTIRPSSLIPSFRRQATVLKLAYSHAIMHANRPFILGNPSAGSEMQVDECLGAAKSVLESVDGMAHDGPIFHAFWWTHYVTFCALLVTYVWEVQQGRRGKLQESESKHNRLLELASRCQTHLANATASNSPSRRYAIILEEFRTEATRQTARHIAATMAGTERDGSNNTMDIQHNLQSDGLMFGGSEYDALMATQGLNGYAVGPNLLDEWQTTDWLDLDSSVSGRPNLSQHKKVPKLLILSQAFGPYLDAGLSPISWMPNLNV